MLSILMIAGLALAPISRPVMADVPSNAQAAVVSDHMAEAMDGDMPCCPSKAAVPIDCDKCVFMAACMSKCFVGIPALAFEPVFAVAGSLSPPQTDFWPDGLGHPPPDHPPRTSI